jgi:hypothetical protein
MDAFIVTLRDISCNYEAVAIVVAESETEAIAIAIDECSFEVVHSEVDCERICEEEPCIYWLQ